MADELETGGQATDTGQDSAPSVTPPRAGANFDDGFDVLDRRGQETTTATTTATTPTGDPRQTQPPTTDQPAFPQDLEAQMRRAGLRVQPGETPDAARGRLFDTMHGWNQRLRNENERALAVQAQQAQATAELRDQLAPLIRSHWEQQQAAATAALAEQIPEPGTPEYAMWLQEENLRLLEEMRQETQQQKVESEQAEQERLIREEEARVDGYGLDVVARALGQVEGAQPDPEFTSAYTSLTRVALTALRQRFPNSSEAQIREFVAETQRQETRQFLIAGLNPVQAIKDRYKAYRDAFVVNAGGANGNGSVGSNGHQPQPTTTPAPSPIGSPNAQRIQAEAAAAARRGPVAAPVTSRPVAAGANGLPLDALDYESSDDYVEAVLAGLVTEAQRQAPPRRRQRAE